MHKRLGFFWGILFISGGILGFVPGITNGDMFLGFFMVNTPHNILHITTGVLFLIASFVGAARWWFGIFGGFYVLLAAIGFRVGTGLIFNLISSSLIDSWGHLFLGLVLLAIGVASFKPSRPAPATPAARA
jgi:hypothetical protein